MSGDHTHVLKKLESGDWILYEKSWTETDDNTLPVFRNPEIGEKQHPTVKQQVLAHLNRTGKTATVLVK